MVVGLVILLLVTLDLMSSAVQNSAQLSRIFVPLLAVNLLGLVVLLVLIGSNVTRLIREYRSRTAGSRLTVRLALVFAFLSLFPVSVVYYYSLGFLMSGIDSWFDVEIDAAMDDALELSQASLGLTQRMWLSHTDFLLRELSAEGPTELALSLSTLREQWGATELSVISPSGSVVASANANPAVLVPDLASPTLLAQAREGKDYVGLVPQGEEDLFIRVLKRDPSGSGLVLQGLFPTSQHIGSLSAQLEAAYDRFKELSYLRRSLKVNFVLTLTLVLMFGMLAAVWAALHFAGRLVAPIKAIANGTRAVAAGDYDKQLQMPRSQDELAFLVASFNAMTRRIAQARDEAARSQQEVEDQRSYLETVLGRLSTGVMTFDSEHRLRRVNPAAQQILRADLKPLVGHSVLDLAEVSPRLQQFVDAVSLPLSRVAREWREEVTLYGGEGRQVLLCASTPFIQSGVGEKGHVLVFDDITTLIKAQRDAAWGEVARRLAHEIKNPLTPIQLAAERLRHKYLRSLPAGDARVLDRATHTIVQQVEAMKEMVNAFSEYARPPKMQSTPLEIDRLVADVLDLYRSGVSTRFEVTSGAPGSKVEGDPLRLRQVVHNLIKNAQEAIRDRPNGTIWVSTSIVRKGGCESFELRVADNGDGFPKDVLPRLFEPYVTTKEKGTGLGLAIVKKIVEEHGGSISAENVEKGGSVVLRLPMIAIAKDSAADSTAPLDEETQQIG